MPYYNLLGDREAKTASSEVYKKYIRMYLEAKGYTFKSDSKVEGHLADLIFVDDKTEKYREIWVEAKWSEFSFNNSAFLSEFSSYLLSYFSKPSEERFRFMIFVRKARNEKLHKNLLNKLRNEEILEIVSKVRKEIKTQSDIETFENLGVDDLKSFFGKIDLYQADIDSLKIRIEQLVDEEFDPKNIFLKYKNLEDPLYLIKENDLILANLFEIKDLKSIWQAHTDYKTPEEIFSNIGSTPPFVLYEGNIISLYSFNRENALSNVVDLNSIEELRVEGWISDKTKINVIYHLLNITANKICHLRGLRSDNKGRWFFPKMNISETTRIQKWKKGRRTYSRKIVNCMKKEGTHNFCYHPSVVFRTRIIDRKIYYTIIPQKTFTTNGQSPVSAKAYEKIERKYRKPIMGYNQNALNDILFWHHVLFEHFDIFSDPLKMSETERKNQYHTRRILNHLNLQPIMSMGINYKPIEDPQFLTQFERIADYEITDFFGDEK